MYQLKYADNNSKPCAIENSVNVNFFGTFISKNEIEIEKSLEISNCNFI